MKILHFSLENFARVPANLVRAERKLGHESYLMTLYPSAHQFHDEDMCLDLPFVAKAYINRLKIFFNIHKRRVENDRLDSKRGVPIWRPSNVLVKGLFFLRDKIWEPKIRNVLESIHIHTFDLLFLDGGAGFLRSGRIVQELKQRGMKIGVLYCGSDLRTRGIIPRIDRLADYRFTVEFDHTLLDPGLRFLFSPFELPQFSEPGKKETDKVRIGHSPTNRAVKGTDIILEHLNRLKQDYPIEIVMIENLSHQEALRLKKSCDIFVDNIGQLGYGISSLEALAMGIPTAVELLPDFERVLGQHPFINISKKTLSEKLIPFIQSKKLRKTWGEKGKKWVKNRHDSVRVAKTILKRVQKEASL